MNKILVLVAITMLFAVPSLADWFAEEEKLKDTLHLEQNYKLHLVDLDLANETIELQLIPGKNTQVVREGNNFALHDDNTLIVEANFVGLFEGVEGYLVILDDLVQYDKLTGEIIFTKSSVFLFKPYTPPYGPELKITNDTLSLKQGYELFLVDVNVSNRTASVQLTRPDGDVVYDRGIIDEPDMEEDIRLYDSGVLVVEAKFGGIFVGTTFNGALFKNLTQYDKNTGKIKFTADRVFLIKPD